MKRFIILVCGYAESMQTSALIYQCGFSGNPGFASAKEAITNLALDLYARYYDDCLSAYEKRYDLDNEKCCINSLNKDKNSKFCSECGKQISDSEFDDEQFMNYIREFHSSTIDSYGETEYAGGRELTWFPFWIEDFIGAPKKEIIPIIGNAGLVLLQALLEAKPELKVEGDDFVCQEWEDIKAEEK